MGNWQLLFPSKYLSAPDLMGKEQTFVIEMITRTEIDGTDEVNGKTVEVKLAKGLVTFKGVAKQYVLTKAVGYALEAMFGTNETKEWIGKPVTLYTPSERWFNEDKPRIRVRGSPLLKAPISKTIKLGRKKYSMELIPTKTAAAPAPAPVSEPGSAA